MTDYINYFGDSTDINAPILKINEKRCKKCNKLLGYISGSYEIKCPRCGEMNTKKLSEIPPYNEICGASDAALGNEPTFYGEKLIEASIKAIKASSEISKATKNTKKESVENEESNNKRSQGI